MSENMNILYQDRGLNVSNRYNVISTIDVVEQFQSYGFETTSVLSASARTKSGFQQHMVRMKSDHKITAGLRPEVIIHNSYDGTKALNIRVGLFRFVCSNGVIIGENLVPNFRIMHSNNNWQELVNDFIDTYDEKYHLQQEWVQGLSDRQMGLDEAYHMAEQVLEFRHSDQRIKMDVVDPLELLIVKRKEDRGDSAWHRFNTIQENLVNGYFHKYDNEGTIRKAKIMTNIEELIRLNTKISDTFGEVIA